MLAQQTEAIQNEDDTIRLQVVKDGYLNYRLLQIRKSLFPPVSIEHVVGRVKINRHHFRI